MWTIMKNQNPLPLSPELFQSLRSAAIFTKLDLQGACNLVQIREGGEWPSAHCLTILNIL